jgi:hypothetical protein
MLGVAIVCALAAASAVLAAEFGANDDTARYAADGGEAFYAAMAATGLRQSVVNVRWRPGEPSAVDDHEGLDRLVAAATRHGIRIVFAVFPYPPREIEAGLASPAAFADWLTELARRYPEVRQYVVGNEPNQPAFWRPQFDRSGRNVSAASFGPYLGAAYDALKAIDPEIRVIGVGLSPRGNDKPGAISNISTSPVRFLAALGEWFRGSGRDRPLMDGFSFHPYPARATDPLELGYAWPSAGFVNLDRIKQALWDAFAGTAQPTTVDGLRLHLDEVGWQVDTTRHPGYVDAENVPVTDELTQAEVYVKIVRLARCDRDVAEVNVFGFYDDRDRRGFQAGLHRVDGTPRPAAEAVRAALLEPVDCTGTTAWSPAAGVVGVRSPRVAARRDGIEIELRVGEGAVVRACVYPGSVSPDVAARLPAVAGGRTRACMTRRGDPRRSVLVTMPRALPGRGGVTVGVRVTAETNEARRSAFATRVR